MNRSKKTIRRPSRTKRDDTLIRNLKDTAEFYIERSRAYKQELELTQTILGSVIVGLVKEFGVKAYDDDLKTKKEGEWVLRVFPEEHPELYSIGFDEPDGEDKIKIIIREKINGKGHGTEDNREDAEKDKEEGH